MYNDIIDTIGFVISKDAEVGNAMKKELERQQNNIELIASENFVSPAVLAAMGSVLTNKYAEGYPGNRYYGGCDAVDIVENIARDRACELFGAEYANVQPHSGAQANQCAYAAIIKPGDTVLGMDLDCGGHLTHGSPANFSGKLYNFIPYYVDEKTGLIDYEEIRRLAKEHKPKLIMSGASSYPREIRFDILREIADECSCMLMADIAHIAGLVVTGNHMNPVPYCDIVTTTTHKTLRGPRGGLILCRKEYAKAVDKAVFPGSQGGPLMNVVAAKAVCFGEAKTNEFKVYQDNIIKNTKALAEGLINRGFALVSGGTDNHLVLLDTRPYNLTGKEAEKMLDSVNITTNKNVIPHAPLSSNITSGIRIGTPAATTRGLNEDDMRVVADLIADTLSDYENKKDTVIKRVKEICEKYPLYK